MQRIKLPQIQGYYLTLTLKEFILTLEIEEESSGNVSFLDLEEELVYEATNGFETLQGLFQGLKSAANGSYPEINVLLSKEKLTYIGSYSIGTDQVEHYFILKFQERRQKHEVEIQKSQKNLQALERENGKMAQRLEELERFRLEEFERFNKNLKASLPFKLNFSFDKKSENASYFNLINNKKTAIMTSFPEKICDLRIFPQIPPTGEYSYLLKINQKKNCIFFGITTNQKKRKSSAYLFCTSNGMIYEETKHRRAIEWPFIKKNSILQMIVNMDQGTLAFCVDNKPINFCSIEKSDKYFAYIWFQDAGQSVTLL